MINIFIDTATFGCNLALFDDESVIAVHHEPIERGHAETINPLIERLLKDNNKTPQDIQNIYTTIGPGSFTGLRVGLTVAQFMGFSLKKPVHGLTTFQAFSCGLGVSKDRTILIETKRGDYYMQVMDKHHKPLSEPSVVQAKDVHGDVITGDAVERFLQEVDFSGDITHQSHIDIVSVLKAIQSQELDYYPAEAFYARDADVSKPKAGRL